MSFRGGQSARMVCGARGLEMCVGAAHGRDRLSSPMMVAAMGRSYKILAGGQGKWLGDVDSNHG